MGNKKLGLCVRYDCNNYGSMLQIYATQKAVSLFGWDYEIIRYDKSTPSFYFKNLGRLFNPLFMRGKITGLKKNARIKQYPAVCKGSMERLRLFGRYRKEFIGPFSPVYKGYDKLAKAACSYDAVMVGSDQLWTPAGLKTCFYNLLFVPDEVRKISLATSFGVTEVPGSQIELTAKFLRRIDYLSVREVSGSRIVKDLTGRDVVVALDPTLLFEGKDWISFFDVHQKNTERYIFAYFLGTSDWHRDIVEKFAKATGLKVVTCPQMDEFVKRDLTFGDEQLFETDPVDFLNLIYNAEYVCTDSFHGTVFSILFHKQFLTFYRYADALRRSKNTRIDSLLGLLGLEGRCCSENCNIGDMLGKPIDFDSVDEKLISLRNETMSFLAESLT